MLIILQKERNIMYRAPLHAGYETGWKTALTQARTETGLEMHRLVKHCLKPRCGVRLCICGTYFLTGRLSTS